MTTHSFYSPDCAPPPPTPLLAVLQDVLTRYKKGGGVIYDYEFLANPQVCVWHVV